MQEVVLYRMFIVFWMMRHRADDISSKTDRQIYRATERQSREVKTIGDSLCRAMLIKN